MVNILFFIIGALTITTGISIGIATHIILSSKEDMKKVATSKISYLSSKIGVKEKGEVFFPKTEGELSREYIINENNEKGLDTPIKDLK